MSTGTAPPLRRDELCDTTSTGYRSLARQVRDAGLLERRPGYYTSKCAVTVGMFALGIAAMFVVDSTLGALALAAGLALASTQVVFLGHDAGHLQVWKSAHANRALGLVVGNLMTGLSFGWWVPKHNAHHMYPNQAGRDPDIGVGVISFTEELTRTRQGAGRWLARWQAWLFFPLLLLEGVAMQVTSVRSLARRRDRGALVEGALVAAHGVIYFGLVFWALPLWTAIAFIAVHQSLFGLYLGCSFAPNHKGMPILDGDSMLSFAERQIITARNLRGGWLATLLLGGLNYQIEHHLFPTMPRPNLRRAQPIIRAYCAEQSLPYNETSLIGSYRIALTHLARVGSPVTAPGGG